MERIAPAGDVYQAGTLSGNPLATAAGLATLRLLDERAYARLGQLAQALADGLAGRGEAGVEASTTAEPGLLTLFFAPEPPRNYEEARACDTDAYGAFCRAMLERGIYLPPSQFEAWFPSLAHADAHVEQTLAAARGLRRAVSALAEVVAAADPALAPYAVSDPGPGASPTSTGSAASCSRPSTRAT